MTLNREPSLVPSKPDVPTTAGSTHFVSSPIHLLLFSFFLPFSISAKIVCLGLDLLLLRWGIFFYFLSSYIHHRRERMHVNVDKEKERS